jgi:hypothetical protein
MTLLEVLEQLLSTARHTDKSEFTLDIEGGTIKVVVRRTKRLRGDFLQASFSQAIEGLGKWLSHSMRARYYVGNFADHDNPRRPAYCFHVDMKQAHG